MRKAGLSDYEALSSSQFRVYSCSITVINPLHDAQKEESAAAELIIIQHHHCWQRSILCTAVSGHYIACDWHICFPWLFSKGRFDRLACLILCSRAGTLSYIRGRRTWMSGLRVHATNSPHNQKHKCQIYMQKAADNSRFSSTLLQNDVSEVLSDGAGMF